MGKLKIAIAAIVIAGLAVALVIQQQTIGELRQQIEDLKKQVVQIPPLQEQLDKALQDAVNVGGTTESQKRELVKLRSEVVKLRAQTKDMTKAQQEIDTLTQRLAAVTASSQDAAAALQAETQKRQGIESAQQQQQHMNACINNLRLIDSAKQQWALENKKQAADTPTWEDLRPYIGRGPNGDLPTCPDGGVYTIGTVGEKPTCGTAGHVLP
jgi:DNA repair exonuclease SbcCD ATPase subunit